MKKPSDELQRDEMLQRIIGLGERSLKKSYYPELQKQVRELEKLNLELQQQIQERQRAEKQKEKLELQLRHAQKMEAIGTLAGGIAHDFNNILSAIVGYTELAKIHIEQWQRQDAGQAITDLDGVLRSADRAKQLVQQLLSFSRQQAGTKEPVNLEDLLVETARMLRALIPTTIALETVIQATMPMVRADATQLHQVIMNLGTNAYHAMRQHGGRLLFELTEKKLLAGDPVVSELQLEPGPYLVLRVTDTGCGMDRATLNRIFDPYFSTRSGEGGTGLGLAVVHGIISAHKGHISVYSEPGQGTTFRVYLPKLVSVEPQKELYRPDTAAPCGHERLLIVDDEPALREVQARILESLGYEVTVAATSTEALQMIVESPQHFDLLVTDMNMPAMSGAELIRQARLAQPNLPVILCTGFSEAMNEKNTKALGHALHLMKPVTQHDLHTAIRRLLANGQSG